MPIDPSIPLAVNPPPNAMQQMGQVYTLADLQQKFQANQRAVQADAAMRNVFADKANLTPEGTLKPEALQQIMAIDPRTGMQMQKLSTDNQLAQANLKGKQSELDVGKHQAIEDYVRTPSLLAYTRAIERGLTPQAANDVAQQIYSDGMKDIAGSGRFSEQEIAQMPTNFDFARVSPRSQAFLAYQEQQRKAKLEERKETAEENYKRGSLGVEQGNLATRRDELAFNRQTAAQPNFSAPVPLEYKDKDGKSQEALARLDSNPRSPTNGKYVSVEDGSVIQGKDFQIRKGATTKEVSPEAADFIAGQVLAGNKQAGQGFARNPANVTAITNAMVRMAGEQGVSPATLNARMADFQGTIAAERTIGTRTAGMEIAANEVKNMAPLALQASEAVDRTKYPRLNSIIQAAEKGTGDENIVRFGLAANSLIYTYSKFLNPTGIPTDADKAKATEILDTAWSKGQFKAAVDQIKKEIASGQAALVTAKDEIGGRAPRSGEAPAEPKPGTPKVDAAPATPTTQAEFDALPSGALFINPSDGQPRRKK